MGHGFSGYFAGKFIDRIYDQLSKLDADEGREGKEGVKAPELYVGVLLLHNNINKYSPGKWVDPPKKSQVYKMLEQFDYNHDKVLDRQEFHDFCAMFFPNVTKKVLRDLFTTFFITPMLVYYLVTNFHFVKRFLPESVIGALTVSLLNATGFFRFLDDWFDTMLPGGHLQQQPLPSVASAYPYGFPSGPAPSSGTLPGSNPSPVLSASPVLGMPALNTAGGYPRNEGKGATTKTE